MISQIRGILAVKKVAYLVIDVNGIGYEVYAPLSTFQRLPEVGGVITLLTHFQVREDAQVLYGFWEEQERALFRALIKVSGVGPKMALAILSGMEVRQFIHCVEKREIGLLVRLPGVGKKIAERLVVEMAGKLEGVDLGEENFFASPNAVEAEAVSALIALGYKPQEASRAVGQVVYEGANSQELIRRALQGLAKV